MLAVAASSFSIHAIRQWRGCCLIHLLSIFTLVMPPLAVIAARRGDLQLHRRTMYGLFLGGLVIAGLFTPPPGRIMHETVFTGVQ